MVLENRPAIFQALESLQLEALLADTALLLCASAKGRPGRELHVDIFTWFCDAIYNITHTYIYLFIYVYIYIYIYIHICMYIYTHVHTSICATHMKCRTHRMTRMTRQNLGCGWRYIRSGIISCGWMFTARGPWGFPRGVDWIQQWEIMEYWTGWWFQTLVLYGVMMVNDG